LETCGPYLPKKKLNFFINLFQYYIKIKEPISMDIEFAIQDAFAVINPELKIAGSIQEAGEALHEAIKQDYQFGEKIGDVEEVDDEHVSDDGIEDDVEEADDIALEEAMKSSQDESDDEGDSSPSELDEEEDQAEFVRQTDERDPEIDADFDRELAKLMSESMDSRKLERKTRLDVPLPMRRTQRDVIAPETQSDTPNGGPGLVKFSLLTKRGNKQQVFISFFVDVILN
jgi:regulator of nonsense transcripts 2